MKKEEEQKINKLCRHCIRPCKQPESMLLLSCPRYKQRPFKAEDLRFKQLDLFNDR